MRQDVKIRLDSEGTKAAATIAIIAGMSAAPDETPPREVYLTRPFLWAIVDTETNLPLFLGTVDRL